MVTHRRRAAHPRTMVAVVTVLHRQTTRRIVRIVHQIVHRRVVVPTLGRVMGRLSTTRRIAINVRMVVGSVWLSVLVRIAPAGFCHRPHIVRVVIRVTPIGRGVLRIRILGGINPRRILRYRVAALAVLTSGILANDTRRSVR